MRTQIKKIRFAFGRGSREGREETRKSTTCLGGWCEWCSAAKVTKCVGLKVEENILSQGRYAKDFQDLIWMLEHKVKNLSEEELKNLCEKYANIDLFIKLKQMLK